MPLFKKKNKNMENAKTPEMPETSEATVELLPRETQEIPIGFDEDDDEDPFSMLPGGVYADGSSPTVTMQLSSDEPVESSDQEWDATALMDKEIERMLKADSEAASAFKPKAVEGIIKSQEIWDGTEMEDPSGGIRGWKTFEERKNAGTAPASGISAKKSKAPKTGLGKRLSEIPLQKMVTIAAIVLMVILGAGVSVVFAARSIVSRRMQLDSISHFTPIEQPMGAANNNSFIFVNEALTLNDQTFTLIKISASHSGTYFYFQEFFDPNDYSITLYDQNNVLFHRVQYDIAIDPDNATILKFDALLYETIFLILNIHDLKTNENISFYYRFNKPVYLSAPVYLNKPISVVGGDDAPGVNLVIHHGMFDSAGSELHYYFQTERGRGLLNFNQKDKPLIHLRENIYLLPILSPVPTEVYFSEYDTTLGKINFGPVSSLNNTFDITFNDLYYAYRLPQNKISVVQLFSRETKMPHIIYTGTHRIWLERMTQQGSKIILVLYGEDPDGERQETRLDITLRVELDDEIITIPGECRVSPKGTDVLFHLLDEKNEINYQSRLFGVPLEQYFLVVNNVEFLIPELTFNVDLSDTVANPDNRLIIAEYHIWEAFMSRLEYKSDMIDQHEIVGFSRELINDRNVMRHYNPAGVLEVPKYAAKIVNSVLTADNVFMAVVEDEWIAGEGSNRNHFRLTHQITAVRVQTVWVIISDIII